MWLAYRDELLADDERLVREATSSTMWLAYRDGQVIAVAGAEATYATGRQRRQHSKTSRMAALRQVGPTRKSASTARAWTVETRSEAAPVAGTAKRATRLWLQQIVTRPAGHERGF